MEATASQQQQSSNEEISIASIGNIQTESVSSEIARSGPQTEILSSVDQSSESSESSYMWWILAGLLVVFAVAGYFFVKRNRGSYEN